MEKQKTLDFFCGFAILLLFVVRLAELRTHTYSQVLVVWIRANTREAPRCVAIFCRILSSGKRRILHLR